MGVSVLNFKPIEVNDIGNISVYLRCQHFRTCDYSVGGIFMWRHFFKTEFAVYADTLFFKTLYLNNRISFTFPIGKLPADESLKLLENYAEANHLDLNFCTVPAEALIILQKRYGSRLDAYPNRDWFDYLYNIDSIINLSGKKYNTQRNHTNKFKKLYTYKYVEITPQNIGLIHDFLGVFHTSFFDDDRTAKEEFIRAKEILQYIDLFNLMGGYIEVEGKIVAFSVGEIVNDTLFVHLEKALKEYPGSYQTITNEFAKNERNSDVLFINREEDVGDLGLRKSKMSYHPEKLLEKYTVCINNKL